MENEGEKLWRTFARSIPSLHVRIDPGLLAAYIEDRCSDEDAEVIEFALCADPELLEAVLDAKAALFEAVAVPPGLADKIKTKLRVRPAVAVGGRWARVLLWSTCAAAALLVSILGYKLGTLSTGNGAWRGVEAIPALSESAEGLLSLGYVENGEVRAW